MIINGIDNESITLYRELLEYGFEDIVFIDSDWKRSFQSKLLQNLYSAVIRTIITNYKLVRQLCLTEKAI